MSQAQSTPNNFHQYFRLIYNGKETITTTLDFTTPNLPFIDDEHWTPPTTNLENVFYSCHHCVPLKTHKRSFVKGVLLFWDIDGTIDPSLGKDPLGKSIKVPLRHEDHLLYEQAFFAALPMLKGSTTIIDSGNGLHFVVQLEPEYYYGEITTLDKEKYKKICNNIDSQIRLRQLPGLCDNVFDNARILRVPNTINAKPGKEVKACRVLLSRSESFSGNLDSLLSERDVAELRDKRIQTRPPQPMAIKYVPVATDTKAIITGCAFLKHCHDNAHVLSEPHWYAMVEILSKLDNGRAMTHELSSRYNGYSFDETERKYNQALKIEGLKRCDYIETIWNGCSGCANYQKHTSPLQIKEEAFIATERNGFWNIRIDSKGNEIRTPNYDDLVKKFAQDKIPIYDTSTDCVYIYRRSHYVVYKDADINSFAENTFDPSPKNKEVSEFLCKVKRVFNKEGIVMGHNTVGKLNLANGVYDLATDVLTKKWTEGHSPDNLFTATMSYNYDPSATCPMFESFLSEMIPEKPLRESALDFITYALYNTDMCNNQFLMFHGHGANGKTQLFRILKDLFGELYLEAGYDIISNVHERMQLKNKHLFVIEEMPKSTDKGTWDKIKTLVSGGEISARALYKDSGTFASKARIIMSCNNLPANDGDNSDGFYRRFLIIPLMTQFGEAEGYKKETIAISSEIIANELPGILNILIERADRLKARRFQIVQAQESVQAVEEYKRDKDIVRAFIDDMIVHKKLINYFDKRVVFANLYKSGGINAGSEAKLWSRGPDIFKAYGEYITDDGSSDKNRMGRNKFLARFRALLNTKPTPVKATLYYDEKGALAYNRTDVEFEGYPCGILLRPKSEDNKFSCNK